MSDVEPRRPDVRRPEPDKAAAELSLFDALEQIPAEYDRAKELTREALQLLEAER